MASFCLVQFVEDGLYHVCPKNHVRPSLEERGFVSAKYRGIYFGAVVIGEGDKKSMEDLKSRCILNDEIKNKYKLKTPSPSHTNTSSLVKLQSVKKSLFPTIEPPSVEEQQNVPQYSATQDEIKTMCNITIENKECPVDLNEDKEINPQAVVKEASGLYLENTEATETHYTLASIQSLQVTEEDISSKTKKKYYCPFCRSLYRKFSRHLFQVHAKEKEVEAAKELDKKSSERLKIISVLRAKGAKMFNSLVASPTKVILPRKRTPFLPEHYIECHLCGNMYKKKFLFRHIKICPKGDGSSKRALKTAKLHECSNVYEDENDPIKFSQVIAGMRDGQTKSTIVNDTLLVKFGKYLCRYYGNDVHLKNTIRNKLRQLGELLIAVKGLDSEIISFKDIFKAKNKQTIFDGIKQIAGYNMGVYKRPSLAAGMSTLLRQCGERYLVDAMVNEDEALEKSIKRWMEVMKSDYNSQIGKHARKELETNQWKKRKTLPLTSDVLKLNLHLKKITDQASLILQDEFSKSEWINLNKGAMIKILLFNRKRPGDVQRIKIDEFKNTQSVQEGSLIYEMLSESEKMFSSQYKRIVSRGKKGKGMPILLTKDMLNNIQLIINLRQSAEIAETNSYVFAYKEDAPFPASAILREMAYACGAKQPDILTGTKLRQQIATATQAFNFSGNDLSILATFLGHSLETHKHFYRLPDEAIQLTKISVVLQALDSGKISELKGKSLDELEETVKKFVEEADHIEDQEEGVPVQQQELTPSKNVLPKKNEKISRRPWSTPEKIAMRKFFKNHLKNSVLPGPMECYEAKNRYSPLKLRSVAQIKAWVNNQNVKAAKTTKPLEKAQ